jgi:hypothetical protein
MSQLYGLLAGLFVCLATWAVTVYVTELAGLLVGLFLLTFFAVSTIYLTGDELVERQKASTKALVDMEVIFFEKLKDIEYKISHLEARSGAGPTHTATAESDMQTLNAMLRTLDTILESPPTLSSETLQHRRDMPS